MTEMVTHTSRPAGAQSTTTGRLFVLELSGDRIHSMNPDGSNRRTIVTDCHLPDGIVVDAQAGHNYWTNKGIPRPNPRPTRPPPPHPPNPPRLPPPTTP